MDVVNLEEKLSQFAECWSPKIVGEVNDSYVKLVKLTGEFVWHHHDREDEMFLVLKGRLRMRFRDRDVQLGPGEFVIVPRGVEHQPVAEAETHVLLFEPKSTLNTGNLVNERTVPVLERIQRVVPEQIAAALANPRRLRILGWLKDPEANFPRQVYGDLVEDGVCGLFIARKLGVTQASASEHLGILVRLGLLRPKRIRQWTFYRRDERRIAQAKKVLQAGI